jgi:hypothetical protein
LAIEVVSPGHPYKDYVDTPDRCAACGILELWIYDPMLRGPRAHGGPVLLQIWHRTSSGAFERLSAGTGPAFSRALGAWLHPQASKLPASARLVISADEAGEGRWPTQIEHERAATEEQRRLLDEERAAREAAEQRARELQAKLDSER